jgi:hypothetical protein
MLRVIVLGSVVGDEQSIEIEAVLASSPKPIVLFANMILSLRFGRS